MSVIGTAGVTPTATKVIMQPSCVQAPAVIASQGTTAMPQNVVAYSGKNDLGKRRSERRHVHPKAVLAKKGKLHSGNKLKEKVVATPVSQATEAVPVAPPMLPIATPIIQPTTVPVATAEVIATTTPADATAVSNMPAIVITGDTPGTLATPTTQFTSSLRQKRTLRDPVSPLVKSGKKSSDKKNDHVHGNVACGRSTTHKDSSRGTVLKAGQHSDLLLGSSLLGMLLLCCCAFVFRRGE